MASGAILGLYGFWLFKRDSSGYAFGNYSDPSNPDTSGGSVTTHAQWFDLPISIGSPNITNTEATLRYGQQKRGSFILGIEDFEAFDIVLGLISEELNNIINGMSANTTAMDSFTLGGEDISTTNFNDIGVLIQTGWQEKGASGFSTKYAYWYYAGQMKQQGNEFTQDGGDNPNAPTYRFAPQTSSVLFNGVSYSTLDSSYPATELLRYPIKGADRLAITTWVADGTDTTFTTAYVPKYTSEIAVGSKNYFTRNGTPEALTTITSGGVVTPSGGAGTDGDIGVLIYPTNMVAV